MAVTRAPAAVVPRDGGGGDGDRTAFLAGARDHPRTSDAQRAAERGAGIPEPGAVRALPAVP